jgi:hypothetical protein
MYADAVSKRVFALDFIGFAAFSTPINKRKQVRMTPWQRG